MPEQPWLHMLHAHDFQPMSLYHKTLLKRVYNRLVSMVLKSSLSLASLVTLVMLQLRYQGSVAGSTSQRCGSHTVSRAKKRWALNLLNSLAGACPMQLSIRSVEALAL